MRAIRVGCPNIPKHKHRLCKKHHLLSMNGQREASLHDESTLPSQSEQRQWNRANLKKGEW